MFRDKYFSAIQLGGTAVYYVCILYYDHIIYYIHNEQG